VSLKVIIEALSRGISTIHMNIDVGLWFECGAKAFGGRPALFLDRDGVIIADTGYVGRAENVRVLDGAADAIARCNSLGIPIVVVTNQSGIGRGYYGWEGFEAVQREVSTVLVAAGAHLDAVLACAYHAEGCGALRYADHPWRKPNPGMIDMATKRLEIDRSRSWIVGDRVDDLVAGRAAGLAGGTLIASDSAMRQAAASLANPNFGIETTHTLAEAVAALIETGRLAADD